MVTTSYDGMPTVNGTQGLTQNRNFIVGYDRAAANAPNAPKIGGLTVALIQATNFYGEIETVYSQLQRWFRFVDLKSGKGNVYLPILVTVTAALPAGAGASTTTEKGKPTQILLAPSNQPNDNPNLGTRLVAELSELIMKVQGIGWFPNQNVNPLPQEGSIGEGLSLFLAREWALISGNTQNPSWSNNWMNTARADWVSQTDVTFNPATFGCALLFLTFLHYQLGIDIPSIIKAGAQNLAQVYQNISGDGTNPFGIFKRLLDSKFPGTSSIPGSFSSMTGDQDNPWPIAIIGFTFLKSSFGADEVNDRINTQGGTYPSIFTIDVEGFNKQILSTSSRTLSGAATTFSGTPPSIQFIEDGPISQTDSVQAVQKLSYSFSVNFQFAALAFFPGKNDMLFEELDAKLLIQSFPFPPSTSLLASTTANLEFFGGANPYFANITQIQPNTDKLNPFYLSNDLRVFTATPGKQPVPATGTQGFPPGPEFMIDPNTANNPEADNTAGAFAYLKALLNWLNKNYNDPKKDDGDPFSSAFPVFPQPVDALSQASSIQPWTYDYTNQNTVVRYRNYSFAIARVHLDGAAPEIAPNAKVFFRLWTAATNDTRFDPNTTYKTNPSDPDFPLPAPDNPPSNFPVFGTQNPDLNGATNTEFGNPPNGLNNLDLTVPPTPPSRNSLWQYYGCFLDFYGSNPEFSQVIGGHHCIVAQLDFKETPIVNEGGIVVSPQTSDKLAQRNLAYVSGGNPVAQTQIIPHIFDTPPTKPIASDSANPLQFPDELIVNWATIPAGSSATIFWPQVNSTDVMALASQYYAFHTLSAVDNHTIQCKVESGPTYIPIPASAGENFSGLLIITLPNTIVKGSEFEVAVQRATSTSHQTSAVPKIFHEPPKNGEDKTAAESFILGDTMYWRQIIGSFSVKIPIVAHQDLLPYEYDALAIMKWRLQQTLPTNRWYPILQQYVEYISDRVEGAGGEPTLVPPGRLGAPPKVTLRPKPGKYGEGCGEDHDGEHECLHRGHKASYECGFDKGKEECGKCKQYQASRKGNECDECKHSGIHHKNCKGGHERGCYNCAKGEDEECNHHVSSRKKYKYDPVKCTKCGKCEHVRRDPRAPEKAVEITGRICEVIFNLQGYLDGFRLDVDCCGEEIIFSPGLSGLKERLMEAWSEKYTVGVIIEEEESGFQVVGLGYLGL